MKYIIALLISSTCLAKEFVFTYNMPGDNDSVETLTYKTEAPNRETAFERAAEFCKKYFAAQKPLDEERILDIVDVCVNPVKTKQ